MIATHRLSSPEAAQRQVAVFAACLAIRGGLTRRQAYRLRLAADEITTNIWTHGYRGEQGVVDLCACVEPDRVWLRTEDDAPPFDPRGYPAAGFGLRLALTGPDQFGYRFVGRNRNTLIMRRPGRGGPGDGDDRERA